MSLIQNTPRLKPFIIKELIESVQGEQVQTILADTDGVMIFLLSLSKGGQIPDHAPPGDALMQIQQGGVIVTVDGTPIPLQEGQSLLIPANANRKLQAQSDMKLQLTLVKPSR